MPGFFRFFTKSRRYDDISASIQEHLDERIDELMDSGSTRLQAEQTARREFGNVTLLRERSREAWQWQSLESLLVDFRHIGRRLRRSPGFAFTVILTLAIGIGANTAVFSVINSILLRPLPYPNSDELIALRLSAPGAGGLASSPRGLALSPSMYLTFAEHNQSFRSIGIWNAGMANITGIAQPEQVKGIAVSDGVLQTLEVPPLLGRWFLPADQDPHASKVVLLSYGYWTRRFGGDRSVLGRTIQVDAENRSIVGVMPRGFRIVDRDFDLLAPLALDRATLKLAPFGYNGIGRLKPGIQLAQANAEIARLVPLWMDTWSNGPGSNPHYYDVWKIKPNFNLLKEQVIGNIAGVLWVVMATIGLVMLIACTNVANLLLVRSESRHHELAIRAALGAGRARIAREMLVESLVLGLIGGVAATGVAYAGLRLLLAMNPASLPRLDEISLDARSLGFTLLLSLFSGLLFGSIPVFKNAFSQASNVLTGTKRTASESRTHRRSRNTLVVAQVAMALVLMISALLMIRTFQALRNVEPGFADAPHVETVSIAIPDLLIADPMAVAQTQKQLADKLAAIPGVTSVGFAAAVPMDGNDPNLDQIAAEHKDYEGGEPPIRLYNYVSPGYFQSMGTRMVAGRDFTWSDLYTLKPMVIVSQEFARQSWGSASAAIGKRVRKYSSSPWQEVIGVVENVRVHGVDQDAPPTVYWPAMFYDRFTKPPLMDGLRSVTFVLHTSRAGTQGLLTDMQQAVWSINANLPIADVSTMQEMYTTSMARTSFTLVMLAIAGTMALALGLLGIYGVISYSVSQRTREIGIRVALGAHKRELIWMFVRSALVLTGIGAAVGLGAAAAIMRLMHTLLFGISPLDPVTFAVVPIVLVAAGAMASYFPARRTAAVDPVVALRAE